MYGKTPSGAEQEAYKPLEPGKECQVTVVRYTDSDTVVGYAIFSTEDYETEGRGCTISGSVVDDNRYGLPNAVAVLKSGNGSSILQTATTDSDGDYSFTNVDNGPYIVSVVHAEYTFREPEVEVTVENANEIVSNIRSEKNE